MEKQVKRGGGHAHISISDKLMFVKGNNTLEKIVTLTSGQKVIVYDNKMNYDDARGYAAKLGGRILPLSLLRKALLNDENFANITKGDTFQPEHMAAYISNDLLAYPGKGKQFQKGKDFEASITRPKWIIPASCIPEEAFDAPDMALHIMDIRDEQIEKKADGNRIFVPALQQVRMKFNFSPGDKYSYVTGRADKYGIPNSLSQKEIRRLPRKQRTSMWVDSYAQFYALSCGKTSSCNSDSFSRDSVEIISPGSTHLITIVLIEDAKKLAEVANRIIAETKEYLTQKLVWLDDRKTDAMELIDQLNMELKRLK